MAGPGFVGDLAPALADGLELVGGERSGTGSGEVLLEAAGFAGAGEGDGDAGAGEGEAEGGGDGVGLFEEGVLEFLEALPVGLVVAAEEGALVDPGDVGDGAFDDHADAVADAEGQEEVDGFLVGDVEGGLEGVEACGLDGEAGGGAIAGVADEAGFAGVAGFFDDGEDVALLELFEGAGMDLEEVEVVGLEALEGAVDLAFEHVGVPVGEIEGFAIVAALGEEEEVVAAVGEGVADEFLGAGIALGGVDDVAAGVEGLVEDEGGGLLVGFLVADFSAAEADGGDIHAGAAEGAFFHGGTPCAGEW